MRSFASSLLLVTACATTPTVVAPPAVPPAPAPLVIKAIEPPPMRLPDGVRPTGYRLALVILPGEERFTGTITADLDVTQPLERLWLNATELTPTEASFTVGG